MDNDEFRAGRERLGLTQGQLAQVLGVGLVAVQRWEAEPGSKMGRGVNPIAATVMGWLLAGFRPEGWPLTDHHKSSRSDADTPGGSDGPD